VRVVIKKIAVSKKETNSISSAFRAHKRKKVMWNERATTARPRFRAPAQPTSSCSTGDQENKVNTNPRIRKKKKKTGGERREMLITAVRKGGSNKRLRSRSGRLIWGKRGEGSGGPVERGPLRNGGGANKLKKGICLKKGLAYLEKNIA